MTNHAALRELADRLDAWGRECEDLDDPHSNVPGVFLSNLITGDFYDAMKEAATQLRTAASEGMAKPFAHLVMTEWNSIAWWTTESAERAQQEADELMRYDSKRKLTVVTVYTHPPEVARYAGRYRWLRDNQMGFPVATIRTPNPYTFCNHEITGEELDAAIDAALRARAVGS